MRAADCEGEMSIQGRQHTISPTIAMQDPRQVRLFGPMPDANQLPLMAEEQPKPALPAKRVIKFRVNGEPKAMGRPRAFAQKMKDGRVFVRAYNPTSAEGFKSAIAEAARFHVPFVPMQGPIKLSLVFHMPRPKSHFNSKNEIKATAPWWHTHKPDRDNLEKTVLDALTTIGMWRDDAQVCAGEIEKIYSFEPGVHVTLEEL